MCDCFSSSTISFSLPKFTKPQTLTLTLAPSPKFLPQNRFPFFRSRQSEPGKTSSRCSVAPENHGLRAELGFKEKDEEVSSEFLEPKGENFVSLEDGGGGKEEGLVSRAEARKGKQVLTRSSLLAKQVISIRTALSLGFVSQLWVDTGSWVVLFLEVRSNLLSGECERFLLDDVTRVGDVVLVEDETVIDSGFKMIGLETLVGYKVVTPGRRNIGKVRGYTFNINSGAIESLELDSFGISIIPSSLVSTYALLVEDVLEVLSDAVVIHEAAASRIQRLTKGFLDSQGVGTNIDDLEEYSDFERPFRLDRSTRSSKARKPRKTEPEIGNDWELPMDYL